MRCPVCGTRIRKFRPYCDICGTSATPAVVFALLAVATMIVLAAKVLL
jgi:hypothetical protein